MRFKALIPLIAPWALAQGALEEVNVADSRLDVGAVHRELPSSNLTSSCASYLDCQSCYESSSFCHWCDKDQECHAKGSVHGCAWGVSCGASPNQKNDTDDAHGCNQHMTCSECVLASHLCHWCAHDNACHSVGSFYGCVSGVDCYSNSRCKRKKPEPIEDAKQFPRLNTMPLVSLFVFAGILFCCASSCLCLAGGIKGAYDDLAVIADSRNREADEAQGVQESDNPLQEPLLEEAPDTSLPVTAEQKVPQGGEELPSNAEAAVDGNDGEDVLAEEATPLVSTEADDHSRPMDGSRDDEPITTRPSRPSSRRPRHMQRLYNVCVGSYVVIVAVMAVTLFGSFKFYPRVPEYSVCNDAVGWKSVIDGLESIKVSADVEILTSVANPTHFDAVLAMGKGSFTHAGAFVGNFDIPPFVAPAMSITDTMIIAHLNPDKWEAASLATDYYRGNLVLDVDAEATIRIPALFGYSFTLHKNGIVVNISEQGDRHLCHCPKWDDDRNQTMIDFRSIHN